LKLIHGYVTPVICSNLYYLLRQNANHEKVIGKISQLLSILDVLTINKSIVIQALNSDFRDFEDALQNFAAEKKGNINLILTRNTRDFKNSRIGVMTPEDYLKTNIDKFK
jgi:predicted nucleic acid-binding protein